MTSPYQALAMAEEIAEIPGDADGILAQANKYTDMAEIVSRAAQDLRTITDNPERYSALSTDKWLAKTEEVIPKIEDVKGRYEVAGTELAAFANVLSEAQSTARSSVITRDNHVEALQNLNGQILEAGAQPMQRPGDDGPPPAEEVNRLENAAEPHITAITGAHSAWQTAKDNVDERAQTAEDRLNEAIDSDGLSDGVLDEIGSAVDSFVDWAAPVLKILKDVLTVLAAVVGVLSIFFPVLAPLALGLAAATFALSLTLAATGNGTWADVAWDAVGLLSFGVGAAAGATVKGARALLQMNRTTRLTRLATSRGTGLARAMTQQSGRVSRNFQNAMRNGLQLDVNPSIMTYARNPSLIAQVARNGSVDGARFAQIAANATRGRTATTDLIPMANANLGRFAENSNNVLGGLALSGWQAHQALGNLVGSDGK